MWQTASCNLDLVGRVVFSSEAYPFQILILLGGVFLGWISSRFVPLPQRRYLFRLFVVAYLSRVILCYFLYFLSCFTDRPGTFLGADDHVYLHDGLGVARMLDAGVKINLTSRNPEIYYSTRDGAFGYIMNLPFTLWNVYLFQWFGKHPLSVLVVNCLIGALTLFPLFSLGNDLFSPKAGKISATLGAFYPSAFLWSTQDLKDPLVSLATIGIIFSFVRFRKTNHFGYLIPFVMSIHMLSILRPPFHWLFLGVIFVVWLLLDFKWWATFLLLPIIAIVFLTTPQALIKDKNTLLRDFFLKSPEIVTESDAEMKNEKPMTGIGFLNKLRNDRSVGTTLLPDAELNDWGTILFLSPLLLFLTLTAPYPWQAVKPMIAFASIEMIMWYFLIPATLWGVGYGLKKRFQLSCYLLLSILLYGVFISIVQSNVGLLVRFRSVIFLFLFVFTGAGMAYRKMNLGGACGS